MSIMISLRDRTVSSLRYMHPIPGYGEMKRESSDLVRYMLSGSKTIFREFFRLATLKISSFEIYWIRLIWKSLFLSSNLSEIRLKIASWVPQMRVPSQFPLGFTWIQSAVDLISVARTVTWTRLKNNGCTFLCDSSVLSMGISKNVKT